MMAHIPMTGQFRGALPRHHHAHLKLALVEEVLRHDLWQAAPEPARPYARALLAHSHTSSSKNLICLGWTMLAFSSDKCFSDSSLSADWQ
jgi:hypothetical protein